jgi:hypothetical protein
VDGALEGHAGNHRGRRCRVPANPGREEFGLAEFSRQTIGPARPYSPAVRPNGAAGFREADPKQRLICRRPLRIGEMRVAGSPRGGRVAARYGSYDRQLLPFVCRGRLCGEPGWTRSRVWPRNWPRASLLATGAGPRAKSNSSSFDWARAGWKSPRRTLTGKSL